MINLRSQPLNQQLAYHIGLYEDFWDNKSFSDKDVKPFSPIDTLIAKDDGILKEYFNLIKYIDDSIEQKRKWKFAIDQDDINSFNDKLKEFFKKYGIDYNDAFNHPQKIDKDDLQSQTAYYLLARTYKNMSRILDVQNMNTQDGKIKAILSNLKEVKFSPAFYMSAALSKNLKEKVSILVEGANEGSIECQVELAKIYLSYLRDNVTKNMDHLEPPIELTENITGIWTLIEWIKKARDSGNITSAMYIKEYILAVAEALKSLPRATDLERINLKPMVFLAKNISGSPKINKLIDELVKSNGKAEVDLINEFKNLEANLHPKNLEKVNSLSNTIDANTISIHMLLGSVNNEMKKEKNRLETRYPETASVFTKKISQINGLQESLESKTSSSQGVLIATKDILEDLDEKVQAEEMISHRFRYYVYETKRRINDWLFKKFSFKPFDEPTFETEAVKHTKAVKHMFKISKKPLQEPNILKQFTKKDKRKTKKK